MIYPYICEQKHETELMLNMSDDIPKRIVCPECGEEAWRNYSSVSTHIPEHMRASSDLYTADNGANFDHISNKLKHSYPSGRQSKIFY